MSARRIVIGCSVTAVVVLAILIIAGVAAFRHLTATVPIPPAARLADARSVGLAVLRIEPRDPWITGALDELTKYSSRDSKPEDLFPIEVVWVARGDAPGREGHVLSVSLSRNGRMLGVFGDFALWRASREHKPGLTRVEHHGEAITSFSREPLKGHVFIRDTTIYWSDDLETAKAAVDLAMAAEGEAAGHAPADRGPILAVLPQEGSHALAGGILNEGGSLARILTLLPGEALDLPAERLSPIASLAFTFDTRSGSEGEGSITLKFLPGTQAADARGLAEELAARMASFKPAGVTFTAAPSEGGGDPAAGTTITVKASGLDSIGGPVRDGMYRSIRRIERMREGGGIEPEPERKAPADPNQSSSTFQ